METVVSLAQQTFQLGLFRSDYFADSAANFGIKQVEFNTIASSFGGIATNISQYNSYPVVYTVLDWPADDWEIGTQSLVSSTEKLPTNGALQGICEALAEAWTIYADLRAVVMIVVENVTYNICDQRFHEFEIRELHPEIRVIRKTLTEIGEQGKLGPMKELIMVLWVKPACGVEPAARDKAPTTCRRWSGTGPNSASLLSSSVTHTQADNPLRAPRGPSGQRPAQWGELGVGIHTQNIQREKRRGRGSSDWGTSDERALVPSRTIHWHWQPSSARTSYLRPRGVDEPPGLALSVITTRSRCKDDVVSVVYYRSGYEPGQYPSQLEWEARLLVERSRAIKSPSIQYHLAGTKKVQQALARPGAVEKFLTELHQVEVVREIFTGLYSLDFDKFGEEAIQLALANPDKFVLKPQREGGGNNVYGEKVREELLAMKDSKERTAWILMDRISPPIQTCYIVRPGQDGLPPLSDLVSELGIFGVILGDKDNIFVNKQVGHMLRTKLSSADEGGVAAGSGALDSPYLIDAVVTC
uniref:Glutathione synthetase n=1 Tax=Timema cristinae TaxID=61476 RepID=A0A7R9D9G1_TIMCR|nr:unnamed protein product [Timema cristinae]